MEKVIVTTTINPPTKAIHKFEAMKDWEVQSQPFASVTDRDAVLLRISQFAAKGLRDR